MDILQYFDSDFKASVELQSISGENKLALIIYIEDLLKLANERLSDELNWILDSLWEDGNSFDFTTISKSIRKSLQRSYFDTNNKKTIIEYVLSLSKQDIYGQFIIDKAIEILGVIIQQHLYKKIAEITIIFDGTHDLDTILARKRQNTVNTMISEVYQHEYIRDLKKKNKFIKQEWNISNLTPGTVFMQQVLKQFKRSNLDFIQCQYQIIEDSQFGNADYKLKQLIQNYHESNKNYNILVFARSRQTTLQILNYCNETSKTVYFQLTDIINLPEYDIQPIDMFQVTKQMSQMITYQLKQTKNKKEQIRDLICLIMMFRNQIIQLPVPVEFYSIPCILGIYRQFLQLSKQNLVDQHYNISIQSFAIVLQIVEKLNQFYKQYQSDVRKNPNLPFLHITNALIVKHDTIKVGKKQLIHISKLFPEQIVTSKSTQQEINKILKYNDFHYEDPDILFLNLNYKINQTINISKAIEKHLLIDKQLQKQLNKRTIDYVQSTEFCEHYLTAVQKNLFNLNLQQRNPQINTFNYNQILYPDLTTLISYCKQKNYRFPAFSDVIQKYNKTINIKPIVIAILTIPCNYTEINKQDMIPNTSQAMFSREVQLNLQKLQKQFPSIVTSLRQMKYQFESGVNITNLNLYNNYVFNVRFKELIITETQLISLFNDLIPYINKIFIAKV